LISSLISQAQLFHSSQNVNVLQQSAAGLPCTTLFVPSRNVSLWRRFAICDKLRKMFVLPVLEHDHFLPMDPLLNRSRSVTRRAISLSLKQELALMRD